MCVFSERGRKGEERRSIKSDRPLGQQRTAIEEEKEQSRGRKAAMIGALIVSYIQPITLEHNVNLASQQQIELQTKN